MNEPRYCVNCQQGIVSTAEVVMNDPARTHLTDVWVHLWSGADALLCHGDNVTDVYLTNVDEYHPTTDTLPPLTIAQLDAWNVDYATPPKSAR